MDSGTWDSIITTVITMLAVSAFTFYASKQAGKTETTINGNVHEIRLPVFYAWLGWPSTILGFSALLIPILDADNETATWGAALTLVLLFGGLGVAILVNYYYHRVTFDSSGYKVYNWRGRLTSVSWSETKDIKFSAMSGYLKLMSHGKWLRLSSHLVGLRAFLNELEAQTNLKTDKLKLPF